MWPIDGWELKQFSKNKHFFFAFLEKTSLLSRLFRRSGRSKQRHIQTYSAQFPPAEWFNSKAVHLHSVGTQTLEHVSWKSPPLHYSANFLMDFCSCCRIRWRIPSPTLHFTMDRNWVIGRRRYRVAIAATCRANQHLSFRRVTALQYVDVRQFTAVAVSLDQPIRFPLHRRKRKSNERIPSST